MSTLPHRRHEAVVVSKGSDLAGGNLDPLIPSSGRAAVRLLANTAHMRELPPHHLPRAVTGAIVHHDDFVVEVVLDYGGGQATAEGLFAVVGRDDDGETHAILFSGRP